MPYIRLAAVHSAGGDFKIAADLERAGMGGEIGKALDAKRFGPVGAHREHIGIFKTERSQKRDALIAAEPVAQLV